MVSSEFTAKRQELSEIFAYQSGAEAVNSLTKRPSDDELLSLYGLYKQATAGDNTTPKPGMFDLKGKYKWQAWDELKGTSQTDAEAQYIELVDTLLAKYQ